MYCHFYIFISDFLNYYVIAIHNYNMHATYVIFGMGCFFPGTFGMHMGCFFLYRIFGISRGAFFPRIFGMGCLFS